MADSILKQLAEILSVFGILGPPESIVYAALASNGLAVGLAVQDGIRNLLAGVMIIFNPPYRAGDMVKFDGHHGEVTRLDLSVSWLRTFDHNTVMVPSLEALRQAVVNANSGALTATVVIPIDLPIGMPLHAAKAVARDLTRRSPTPRSSQCV
jgi:small-conductance mechanosensitive channel